jgi:hypothetical protein
MNIYNHFTVYKGENTTVEIRCANHTTPSILKSWHHLRRQALSV